MEPKGKKNDVSNLDIKEKTKCVFPLSKKVKFLKERLVVCLFCGVSTFFGPFNTELNFKQFGFVQV